MAAVRIQQTRWLDLSWHEETVYTSGDLFFDALIDMIDQAKTDIILATYIFAYDDLGQRIIKHLHQACQRGVRVRVLFDGFGSLNSAVTVAKDLADAGVDVRIFHPLPWQPEIYQFALRKNTWLGNVVFRFLHINQRHHCKMYIVDNSNLACGSMNISTSHLAEFGNWHDYGAIVTGQSVAEITTTFDDFWNYRKPKFGRGLINYYRSNITTFTRKEKNKRLSLNISAAKHRVWIINPYFSPPMKLLKSLQHAAKHGIDIRLIVPSKSDVGFFPLLTGTYYYELLNSGVRIFEYLPSILHGKLLLTDESALIGSTNLNYRSMIHDLEFDIVLDSSPVIQQLEKYFLEDQSRSREITLDFIASRRLTRFLGWIPWLLRYWL